MIALLGELFRWRVDAEQQTLMALVAKNWLLRRLTCAERQLYNIEPLCEAGAEPDV